MDFLCHVGTQASLVLGELSSRPPDIFLIVGIVLDIHSLAKSI